MKNARKMLILLGFLGFLICFNALFFDKVSATEVTSEVVSKVASVGATADGVKDISEHNISKGEETEAVADTTTTDTVKSPLKAISDFFGELLTNNLLNIIVLVGLFIALAIVLKRQKNLTRK